MTREPTTDEVRAVLGKIQELQALSALAKIVEPSLRTLQRQLENGDDRPDMSGATFLPLAELFVELGVIGQENDFMAMAGAVREIRRRATLAEDEADAAGDGDDPEEPGAHGPGPGPAA